VSVAIVWLVVAVLLGGVELFTLSAVAGLLGGAALLTAGTAALGLPVVLQFPVFAVAAVAGLLLLRPVAVRHLLHPSGSFGVDALVGRSARVTREVSDQGGTVRVGGDDWTARTVLGARPIPVGATVDIVTIDGATAVVHGRE
jgi:membrane protein implicated in regulation of membrane protease activity